MGCDYYIIETIKIKKKDNLLWEDSYINIRQVGTFDIVERIYGEEYIIPDDKIIFTRINNQKKWYIDDIEQIKYYIDEIKKDNIKFDDISEIVLEYNAIERM